MFKKLFFIICCFVMVGKANATAFQLSSTRVIYLSGASNTSFQVTNGSKNFYGAQVWINNDKNSLVNKDDVFFIPAPAFFTLKSGQVQVVRIINTNDHLPTDRESLFHLNVQEVPQMMDIHKSGVQFAPDIRIKLIYRPKNLQENRQNAEQKVEIKKIDGSDYLINPTPYYFAVVGVENNSKPLFFNEKITSKLHTFAPFSKINLHTNIHKINNFSIKAIDDLGYKKSFELH